MTERSGYTPGAGFRAIHVEDDYGRVRGMVGFDGWTPSAVWLHVAVDKPGACRGLLWAAFDYAFRQCGKQLALANIPACNADALALAERLGFSEVARLQGAWDGTVDLVLLQMRREDCRWLSASTRRAA